MSDFEVLAFGWRLLGAGGYHVHQPFINTESGELTLEVRPTSAKESSGEAKQEKINLENLKAKLQKEITERL